MKRPPACGCCSPKKIRAVTIKGLAKTDGVTAWEYGPGAFWRHHYGADAISGLVPDLVATPDRYAIAATNGLTAVNAGNRNTATLVANCARVLSVVKLDSLDGTTVDDTEIPYLLGTIFLESTAELMNGTVSNAAALSGGDYVMVGRIAPTIEFESFTSNGATKTYVLHPHNHQAGSVFIKTRDSDETITLAFDADAATVEAAFEATADCVSATATGGPWPHAAIDISVTWSASTGDIKSIAATATYSAGSGGGSDYDVQYFTPAPDIEELQLNILTINIGDELIFNFQGGGAEFSYVSTTDDEVQFAEDLAAAMWAFAVAQGLDGFWETVASDPGNVDAVSGILHVFYGEGLTGRLEVTSELVPGVSGSRSAYGAATVINTATAAITSSVGYIFGRDEFWTVVKLIEEDTDPPSVTGPSVLTIKSIGAAAGDTVVLVPQQRGTGDITRASVLECYSIAAGVWSFEWRLQAQNASPFGLQMPEVITIEDNTVCCYVAQREFNTVLYNGTAVDVASSGRTPFVDEVITYVTDNNDNIATGMFLEGDITKRLVKDYEVTFVSNQFPALKEKVHAFGGEICIDEQEMLLGGNVFAADSTQAYGFGVDDVEASALYDLQLGSGPDEYSFQWFFATEISSRGHADTQWRLTFNGIHGPRQTAWLDWYASATDIETAVLAVFPQNTTGVTSNVDVDPFSNPNVLANTQVSWLERVMDVIFTAHPDETWGFPHPTYFERDSIEIELQNVTPFNERGISAWSSADASIVWERPFGTRGATTVTHPQLGWIRGDFVYVYGVLVDNEL